MSPMDTLQCFRRGRGSGHEKATTCQGSRKLDKFLADSCGKKTESRLICATAYCSCHQCRNKALQLVHAQTKHWMDVTIME